VSVEAICWALNLAPVPAGRGGQPSTACKFVLVGLASHAGPARRGRLIARLGEQLLPWLPRRCVRPGAVDEDDGSLGTGHDPIPVT
jgi:hypothetical protein